MSATTGVRQAGTVAADRHAAYNKSRLFLVSSLALVTAGVANALRADTATDLKTVFFDPIDSVHSAARLANVLGVPFLGFAFTIAICSPLLDYISMGLFLRLAVLCVGGGSVLDGAKFVAAAVPYAGEDPWQILVTQGTKLTAALPIGAVLTLPATGSEANGAAVISRRAIKEKLAFISPVVFPKFSILDPETTFSLPARQIANGIGDAFCHVIEQYLTYPADAAVQDRFAESVLRVLIDEGPKTLAHPTDYTARANLVWAATCALNGFIGVGVPQDWATHVIGHELTALHEIDHARTLAIVLPNLMQVQRATKRAKLLQYAERVWDLRDGSDDARIDAAIAKTRAFYESLGIKTRLSDYNVPATTAAEVAQRLAKRGVSAIGERGDITPAKVEEILRLAA